MKRQGSTELPRFVVGALATAGASVASGATVQISFANNYVSDTSIANFLDDVTGDGTADLEGLLDSKGCPMIKIGGAIRARAYTKTWSQYVPGSGSRRFYSGVVRIGNNSSSSYDRRTYPFTFSDTRVNGGAPTNGFLDLMGTSAYGGAKELVIKRLIFNDASASAPSGVYASDPAYSEWVASVAPVPEPSSSLALLALGAGGLLMRRCL